MNPLMLCGALLSASLMSPGSRAQAVAAPQPPFADPLDAQATVPALPASSALSAYRAYEAQRITPWRQANETVWRAGGWKAYAREAQAGSPTGKAATHGPVHGPSNQERP